MLSFWYNDRFKQIGYEEKGRMYTHNRGIGLVETVHVTSQNVLFSLWTFLNINAKLADGRTITPTEHSETSMNI